MVRLTLLIALFILNSQIYAKSTETAKVRYFTLNNFTVDANAQQENHIKDPFEKMNRKIFSFNEMLDRSIVKPVAIQYQEKIPDDVRGSYRSFRKNLGEPWNAVNQIIQGKPIKASKTLGRFAINTLTSLGFADTASHIGLTRQEESLGTTLGYYGVHSGPYLMLPFFGPSTMRDAFGLMIDSQANPAKYALKDYHTAYYGSMALTAIDKRAGLLDLEKTLPEDRYAALRDIYLQRQSYEIAELKGQAAEQAFMNDDDIPEEEPMNDDDTH